MILHACHKDAAYPFIGEKLGATELGIERRAEAVDRMLPQPILEPAAALVKSLGCFLHVIETAAQLSSFERISSPALFFLYLLHRLFVE